MHCQNDETGDGVEPCLVEDNLIPIIHKHTNDDGTTTETELGRLCKAHALNWSMTHLIPKEIT